MAADRVVAVAPHENELAVGDRVHGTLGVAHVFRAAVANRQEREHLRLNDALPEAVHLLISGDAQQLGVAASRSALTARGSRSGLCRVSASVKSSSSPRGLARAGGARPLLAEPACRKRGRIDHAKPRIVPRDARGRSSPVPSVE